MLSEEALSKHPILSFPAETATPPSSVEQARVASWRKSTAHMAPRPVTADRTMVLVVDDEPQIVDVLTLLLEDEGFQVLCAYDGAEAWRMADTYRPDVIISDVMMPGLTGIELAKKIKRSHNGTAPPVILMSAVSDIVTLSGVRFLPKPFDIDQILDLVTELACRREASERMRPGG